MLGFAFANHTNVKTLANFAEKSDYTCMCSTLKWGQLTA